MIANRRRARQCMFMWDIFMCLPGVLRARGRCTLTHLVQPSLSIPVAAALMVCAIGTAEFRAADRLVDRWDVEQGLPNNAITSLLQSRDGYIWIATWAGAARFDGVRFTPIAGNLPNSHATALLEDPDGAMWIGVAGTGLARWRDGSIDVFTTADGLAGRQPRALAFDRDGRLWAATEHGVSILDGGRFRTLRVEQGLPHNTVTSVAASRDGGVWIATEGGLCLADVRRLHCERRGPPGPVDVVVEDRDGRVWAGTRRGLVRVAGPDGGGSCATRCLDGQAITALLHSRDGELWVGLGTNGLARLHAGGIERIGAADGLPAGIVVSLFEDLEGSVWVGSYNGGLARLKRKRLTTISTKDGLPAPVVGSIVQDRTGAIWAGVYCGPVSVWRGGRFVPQFVEKMRDMCALVLWSARDGTLWIGTRENGLFRVRDGRLEQIDGLSDTHVAALFEDRDGTIWIGTNLGGLHYIRDGRLSRAFGPDDGVATPYIASFAQDRDGRVWIGSNASGLSVYENGRFRILSAAEQPPTRNIAGLLVDSRGDLWIGSAADGLFRRRHGRYEAFGVEQGLGDRLVALFLEDHDGNLWVSTARGISRLTRERIDAVADGRATRLDPIIVDRSDGMRSPEGSGGGHDPSGLRDREGRLWFATIDGIVVIDPATFTTNRVAPRVAIEEATLDERPSPRRADGAVEVPAGTRAIALAYTAFSFLAPSKMRFRYRLVGFDEAWHDVGSRRVAYFSRLAPGDYTFEVLAANNDGVWSEQPARARVVVVPFFWERRAVQLAAAAFLLGLTAAIVFAVAQRRAKRRLADLERERALERERTRIARDLHDDLGSRLSHIAILAGQRVSSERDERLGSAAREAVQTMDELVWTVSARNDTLESLAYYITQFAEEHISAARVRCRLLLPADLGPRTIGADVRRHLYLAAKEAVNNAVKHARASEIRLSLDIEGDILRLEIIDDGIGLPLSEADPTGNGLRNLRERMDAAGGSLLVESAAGKGTRIAFRVALQAEGT